MMQILYACFSSLWRRWFGGYDIFHKPEAFFNKRWLRYVIGLLITGLFLYSKYSLLQTLLADAVLFFLYWAPAHGEFFDFGHNNPPDVSRYEKFWWWKYLKRIIPTKQLYQWHCDFLCMTIRYTLPAVLLGLILMSFPIMFAGIILACGYALMWLLSDWGVSEDPTEYGELIGGFVTGLLL